MRQIVSLVALVAIVGTGATFAFRAPEKPHASGLPVHLLYLAVPTVLLAIAGLARAYRDGTLGSWMRVRTGDFTRGFLAALLLFVGAWFFAHSVIPQTAPRSIWLARLYLQLGDPEILRQHVGIVVAFILTMAACEEIVWRGLATDLFAELVGSRRAWICGAAVYALAHAPTMWLLRDPKVGYNPLLVFAALAAGLVWGALTRMSGRLWPAIFSHALFDWAALMMFRLWGPSV